MDLRLFGEAKLGEDRVRGSAGRRSSSVRSRWCLRSSVPMPRRSVCWRTFGSSVLRGYYTFRPA